MARFSRQGSFVRGAVTGVAVSALLVAGLVAPSGAATTYSPIRSEETH